MAPLGIPMSEEEEYRPVKRRKEQEEASDGQVEKLSTPQPDLQPQSEESASTKSESVNGSESQTSTSKSITDDYKQQMRNAAILQAKQAEILQRQSQQLDFSQKLLERYDAILTRLEERQAES